MGHRIVAVAFVVLSLSGLLLSTVGPGAAQGGADLSVAIRADRVKAKVGQNVIYTVIAVNRGPGAASGVALSTNMSDHFNFVAVTCSQGSASGEGGCLIGSMAPGATVTAAVELTVCCFPRHASRAAFFQAWVGAGTVDPDPANDYTETYTRIIGKHASK